MGIHYLIKLILDFFGYNFDVFWILCERTTCFGELDPFFLSVRHVCNSQGLCFGSCVIADDYSIEEIQDEKGPDDDKRAEVDRPVDIVIPSLILLKPIRINPH